MTHPCVSIVMAAKNYARFLPAAIDSVLGQTRPDWELIIVDDGSTDSTAIVVQWYLGDLRIRYLGSDRLGQSRAKNLGLAFCRGDYIAYLDADDIWEPTKLEKQLLHFHENHRLGVCFTQRTLINERGEFLPSKPAPPLPRGPVLDKLFLRNFVCFSSVVVKRVVFEHVGRFSPEWDLSIDYDLWLRVAPHYYFDYVDEPLVRYRTGHGNLSNKLSDRVVTALAIMKRAEQRNPAALGASLVAEGTAATCQTLGYVLRSSEPRHAAEWYRKMLRLPGHRWPAVKGLLACLKSALVGPQNLGSPENARENR
jgi:glycosyltransferase involved in cell wall biosynthesis